MRYLSRLELLGGLLISAGLFSACSLVYDLSADQCEVKADCDALGGEFRGRECRAGVCMVTGACEVKADCDALGGEFRGRECRAGVCVMTGATGGSGGMDAGCKSTSECLDNPENFGPAACIGGECVALTNGSTCPLVVPSDLEDLDDALRSAGEPIILGAFGPISSSLHTATTRNYDLAFTEFNQKTGGLVGQDGRRHGIVGVICATTSERAELDTSRDFLVETLKVPGIVPALFADDLQYVFERKRDETDEPPLFISPLDSDSTLERGFPDGGLLWHLLPSAEQVALAYKPLLTRVVDTLALAEPARVALITTEDIRGAADIGAVILDADKGIEFNGETALENSDDTFLSISMRTTDETSELATKVEALLAFQPHVIISATTDEFFPGIYVPLEDQWNDATGMAPKPFYLLSPYHFNSPELNSKLTALRARAAGVNSAAAPDPELYTSYLSRFRTAYSEVANPEGRENFYDAPYYLIYSVAASITRTPRLRGQDLLDGMRRISESGMTVDIGPTQIPDALTTLSTTTIRLEGTLGPPDFNANGGREVPGSVWCIDSSVKYRSDVLVYDSATGELEFGKDANGDPLEEVPCVAKF